MATELSLCAAKSKSGSEEWNDREAPEGCLIEVSRAMSRAIG
jgi:hypothetical protein